MTTMPPGTWFGASSDAQAFVESNIACSRRTQVALLFTEFVSARPPAMSPVTGSNKSESPPQATLSSLLIAAEGGDRGALEACFPLVYEELRSIARKQRRAWQGNTTLNTTALLHEAYLKMVNQRQLGVTTRDHFFAVAATAMRHILCSYARDQQRQKRGGGAYHVSVSQLERFGNSDAFTDSAADQLSELGEALNKLAQIDKRYTQVVECRFFAGLSVEETASALDLSPATVKRYWSFARAWLLREMQRTE